MSQFEVDLPAGGRLVLRTQDEVDLWDELHQKYRNEYQLTKANDLALLGAILSQHLALFRAQQRANGMVPEVDNSGIPTGRYKVNPDIKRGDVSAAMTQVTKASEEIRQLEKSLGIDKKSREAGGAYNTQDYLKTLKRAAHNFGIHVSRRFKAYEKVAMEARWKIRLLRNGDDEDRRFHDISEASIVNWLEGELARLEEVDKRFAKEKGRLFAGKL